MVFESVPNFSEGRRESVIAALGAAASRKCHLLDVHADAIHNRTVVSVAAATTDPLIESLLEAVAVAARRIDLRRHTGVHPRV